MPPPYRDLNPDKALIFRITHRDNLGWLLRNGIHCGNSELRFDGWVNIGNLDLIERRSTHVVPIPPGGCLGDYVPFYFTPFSPMLLNIQTGRGVRKRSPEEIVILASSLREVDAANVRFAFTNMHAYYHWAQYYNQLSDLVNVDWNLLQMRDFRKDDNDPTKFERYQAEALVHRHLPVRLLRGIVCYSEAIKSSIEPLVRQLCPGLGLAARPTWYFR